MTLSPDLKTALEKILSGTLPSGAATWEHRKRYKEGNLKPNAIINILESNGHEVELILKSSQSQDED